MKIEAVKLSKTYGKDETKVEALKPCTLTIESGEQVAITGASGSGKSTLLHLLGGLDWPTDGCVLYDGRDIYQEGDSKVSSFRLHNIGFVFQAYNLLPELTTYENIILPVVMEGEKQDKDYMDSIIRTLGLSQRLNHLPGELSGGQQQRVAIARALANKPKILLCDEPTGNLDSQNTESVLSLLKEAAQEWGLTLIVVTHNQWIAEQYPRILTIRDGVVGGDL